MTETEKKALALVNEVRVLDGRDPVPLDIMTYQYGFIALLRAIEQHEAFKREVSDAVEANWAGSNFGPPPVFSRFIIAKPDPLVEAVNEAWGWRNPHEDVTENLRAALAARGLEIREKQP